MLHFWAPWSEPSKQVTDALTDLAEEYPSCKFVKVCVCVCVRERERERVNALPTAVVGLIFLIEDTVC